MILEYLLIHPGVLKIITGALLVLGSALIYGRLIEIEKRDKLNAKRKYQFYGEED